MPWQERTVTMSRHEFVVLANQEGANLSALCRQFGISRPTAYKWLNRYRPGPRSRRAGDPGCAPDLGWPQTAPPITRSGAGGPSGQYLHRDPAPP